MTAKSVHIIEGLNNKMTCQLILTNKVCAAVLLLWVMEAMFNRMYLYIYKEKNMRITL